MSIIQQDQQVRRAAQRFAVVLADFQAGRITLAQYRAASDALSLDIVQANEAVA